jgi:hypothetical protein
MKNPESKALEFIFQDTEIHFLLGNEKNVMVNATEMAKAFGKNVDKFTRLEGTEKFIQALIKSENKKFAPPHLGVQLVKKDFIYGTNKATYMHRKLALEFASWLDIDFKVWIIDVIDELLDFGAKKVGNKISDAEQKKIDIAVLMKKVKEMNLPDVNKLLSSLEELKKIELDKKKAMREFTNQYKMF